ncbi:histidine-specific methyltransferase [Mycena sanguinolenta]|nr:histidine-specific methyltransferase [Mycena sanguinolenta]
MAIEIINLRDGLVTGLALDMKVEVLKGLRSPTNGRKSLPSMLLYDELGLKLHDAAAHAPEYYPFGAEEQILREKSDEIVAVMHAGCPLNTANRVVLELGSGSLSKTSHILLALSRLLQAQNAGGFPVTYYALDLEERELERTLTEISLSDVGKSLQGRVNIRGLCATYDQGLKFAASGALHAQATAGRHPEAPALPLKFDTQELVDSSSDSSAFATSLSSTLDDIPPLHIVFLGSSLGNFSRTGGADFLRSCPLRPGSCDRLLIGLDHDNEKSMIEEAYNDRQGYIRTFIMNALKGAGRVLGDENLFDGENWEYSNKYDVATRRHEAFVKAKRAHTVIVPSTKETISFFHDEEVEIAQSLKFSDADVHMLCTESNLRPLQRWTDSTSRYSLWLLERPSFSSPCDA